MSIGLKIKTEVDDLEKLKQYIEYVKKFSTIKSDKDFQNFIQNKFLETVNEMSNKLLPNGDLSLKYIQNNKIRPIEDGFVLYNDTYVETDSEGYGGKFSIALAFEYGTGIVGQNNPKIGAWAYNIKGHIDGWWYPTNESDPNPYKWVDKDGGLHAFTRGFEGYEVYRYTLEEIKKQLPNWVKQYKKPNGGDRL